MTFVIYNSCSTKSDAPEITQDFIKDTIVGALNGVYIGLEEMCLVDSFGKKECYEDPSKPNRKWYHLSYLTIESDSIFLEQNPISIYKKDTSFSTSDGAFYYYNGIYKTEDSIITIDFKMDHCDYCPHEVKKLDNGQFEEIEQRKKMTAVIRSNGLLINGYLFKKKN
ncbi:hypothetical protein FRZ67_14635 [Panacibacter ginsenosidivorans]|uniref:Uncharacterized protein n=1 Tax=Panacibacter ginsenosidivorans TaxID=1813871 RepID=A0A5B8VAV3_9BACT|nr:hypothetical protein [Panacibacter ginsenosidivorans]QEC68482.1 hypothetical protein FRZ67_14635 [Panacibacter ginsenosidivorans]